MKKFMISMFFILFCYQIYAQDKQINKIEKLYRDGKYEKCITSANEYIEKNQKAPLPYLLIGLSHFKLYLNSTDTKREKILNHAVKNLIKGKTKDKENVFVPLYSVEISDIKDTLLFVAKKNYKNDKEKSKIYFENYVKLSNDTIIEYRELFQNQNENKKTLLDPNQIKTNSNQTDANGLKQGFWSKKYQNGKIAYEVTFKDNVPIGEYKRYHENGQLAIKINYDNNGQFGATEFFDVHGKLLGKGFFNRKNKDSLWLYYNEQGIFVMEERYKNGVFHGLRRKYYFDGKVSEESNWQNGIENGVWRRYYASGKVKFEVKIVNGKRDGLYIQYYEDGNYEMKGRYKDDLMEGNWEYYKPESKKPEIVEYINGKAKNKIEIEKKENDWFKKIESNKTRYKDPMDYRHNPEEYFKGGN